MAIPNVAGPELWTKTYTSFGGCDIVALIEDVVIGNLQGISYSVTREKGPIYVMGRADPVSFSRGKRGIAGSLVFTNFDRGALKDVTDNKTNGVSMKYYKKTFDIPAGGRSIDLESSLNTQGSELLQRADANYPDQIPPFNINITAANEYGQSMVMGLFGVELLNQGQGISVDDMVTETQFTFVCRVVADWIPKSDAATLDDARQSLNTRIINTQAFQAASLANTLT